MSLFDHGQLQQVYPNVEHHPVRSLQHKTSQTTLDTNNVGSGDSWSPQNWKRQEGPLTGASEGSTALGHPDHRRLISSLREDRLLLFGASVCGRLPPLPQEAHAAGGKLPALI